MVRPVSTAAIHPGNPEQTADFSVSGTDRLLDSKRFGIVVGLFCASGAAGLIDQVCFSKYLSYVVGATAYAVSAVLAAFMTGLSVGSFFGGVISTRVRRPLVAYAVVEIVVGVTVAFAPAAFDALTPLYVSWVQGASDSLLSLSLLRWSVAMMLIVLPTTAMGMTLPLLAPALGALKGDGDSTLRERRLSVLYAANTFGGAMGAIGAAYFILPALGIKGTLWFAAALSCGAGVLALIINRGVPALNDPSRVDDAPNPEASTESEASTKPSANAPSLGQPTLLTVAFLSGCLVFIAEVVCTHLLAVVVGNSAYAFGLILAVFLLCLFVGATSSTRLHRRLGAAALPISLSVAAFALLITIPAWDYLPFIFSVLGDHVTSFEGRELVRAGVAFIILFIPTTLIGLTFPLLLQSVASAPDVGKVVGRLTAINTVGAVFGALFGGYVLLPWLGSQSTLITVGLVFAAAAVTVAQNGKTTSKAQRRYLKLSASIALCALVVGIGQPKWDLARLTAGTNVYFDGYVAPKSILDVREDVHGGVTSVTVNKKNVHTLYTNGKFQGNNGWEMNAQRYFAHYPSLFVKNFDRALVIGLGTGTTLGTYTAYPWNHIDVVEISPSIVLAAGKYFSGPNRKSLDDPRVTLHQDDGRNHLLLDPTRYDLIGMELSSVWFAGASALYSQEYYQMVREHLTEGGIFQQWVQLHHVTRPVFATLLNSLRQEFPHVALFYGGGQGILVASLSPLKSSRASVDKLGAIADVRSTLIEDRGLPTLFGDVLLSGSGLDRFLSESAQQMGADLPTMVSSDDNLFLEYETPRGNVLPWIHREELVAMLTSYQAPEAVAEMRIP
ncbi:MAG: fused MFS/spermidine synthase [Polyangiaceae bacterium]|nr:fused MFS/spermidine synthase [Polyangiaceae bacterium]